MGLNPFGFRAGFRTFAVVGEGGGFGVLIPLVSGLGSGRGQTGSATPFAVLIPLVSGLGSGLYLCMGHDGLLGLNPFGFRAGFRTDTLAGVVVRGES